MKTARKVTTVINNEIALANNVMDNTYSICGKRIASVPVVLMELDYDYQRVLSKNIKKLIEQWDNDKCEFLFVSYRDNKFFIIDGQHRYFAAKAKCNYPEYSMDTGLNLSLKQLIKEFKTS